MSGKKFKIITVLTMLPVVLWPFLFTRVEHFESATEKFLLLAMPVFAIAAGYFAQSSYKERPEIAWVVVIVAWLTYFAFLGLVFL